MITILQVLSSLNVSSGMSSLVMNYYREIDRKSVQFDFIYFFDSDVTYEEEIKSLGGKCYKIPSPIYSVIGINFVHRFFKEHQKQYYAIHCHPIFSSVLFGGLAKKYGIERVIAHSHSTKYSDKLISAIRNKLLINLGKRVITDFVACTKDAALLFPKKSNVFILHNAIDCDKFRFSYIKRKEIRDSFKFNDDDIVIGHVGRFSSEKNHKFIFEMFIEYLKTNNNSYLLLVGDGPLMEECKKKVLYLGIEEKVFFVGKRTNVQDYLSAMDYFVFPSVFEGFGIALLEAQTSGLFSFASDCLPPDVFVTDIAKKLDINNMSSWIETIKHSSPTLLNKRDSYCKTVSDKGFEINKEAKRLQLYYERVVK